MPFNGSGIFENLLPPDFPAVATTTIRSAQFNNNLEDVASGLSQCLTVNGESVVTANLPLNGYRFTGAGSPVSVGDFVTRGYLEGIFNGAYPAAFIRYTPEGTGGVATSVQAALAVRKTAFDFMTAAEIADVRAGTFLLDVTVACQAFLTYVDTTRYAAAMTSGALTTSYAGTTSEAFFPKGGYRLSADLVVGGYTSIRGEDAIFKQFVDTENILTWESYHISVEGIQFVGGALQLDMFNDNLNATMIRLTRCGFYLSRSYAINTRATGGSYTHLSAVIQAEGCVVMACNKIYNNCADSFNSTKCWFQVSKTNFTASTAAFMNRGVSVGDPEAYTRMKFADCVFVPDIGVEGVDRVNGARWFDNYGSITVDTCRFGGENGGMSILWHYGAPNTGVPYTTTEAVFKNSILICGPDARTDSCVVGLQGEIPNRVVIHNCSGPVGRPLIANLSGLAIPAYLAAYAAAVSRPAYRYFKIDIQDVLTDITSYTPTRTLIPADLLAYQVRGRKAVVARVAAQAILTAFSTNLVSFDTITSDMVGAFDPAQPTRLVMPRGCSKMRISVHIKMAVDGAAKTMACTIMTSGSVRIAGDTSLRGINADSDRFTFSTEVEGVPDSYWVVNIQHNAAGALNLLECQVTLTPLDHMC